MIDDNTILLLAANALAGRCPHLADALRDIVRRDVVRGGPVKEQIRLVILSERRWENKEHEIARIIEGVED